MEKSRVSISVVSLLAVLGVVGGTSASFGGSYSIDANVLTGRAAVGLFLRTYGGDAYEDAVLGDFRILDLDQDGEADLIATIDSSGRGFFNHLLVMRGNGGGLTVQEVDVWNMESLDRTVQDFNGDGRPELLLRKNITPYLGARPMASWTAVFGLDGNQLVDQSVLFPQFYDSVLAGLDYNIAESDTEKSEDILRRDVLIIERDKILRVLGRSLDAGLTSALNWARSEDPVHRIFALSVLSEVEGSEADSTLKTLSKDLDPEVSARARIADAVKSAKAVAP
jgi:hypothetical protein